jgi:hypothetical protein
MCICKQLLQQIRICQLRRLGAWLQLLQAGPLACRKLQLSLLLLLLLLLCCYWLHLLLLLLLLLLLCCYWLHSQLLLLLLRGMVQVL